MSGRQKSRQYRRSGGKKQGNLNRSIQARLLTEVVIDLLQYVGTAVEERINHLLDQRINVLSHWKIVNPFAHANIENAGMQTPDQFELFFIDRFTGGRRQSMSVADFCNDRNEDPLTQFSGAKSHARMRCKNAPDETEGVRSDP